MPASDLALHIPEAILTPLTAHGALEFQGVSHARFAAAMLAEGCVEFRFINLARLNL